MPKVGNNNEPLLERALYGYNGTLWKPLTLDVNDYLNVRLPYTEVIEVIQDTAGDLLATVDIAADQNVQARSYGWIDSSWQKSPLPLGFSAIKAGRIQELNLSAGYNSKNGGTVPAGEIWVITLCTLSYTGTVPTYASVRPVGLAGTPFIIYQLSPVSANKYIANCNVFMGEGHYLMMETSGATSTDDLQVDWAGFRVDIDQ